MRIVPLALTAASLLAAPTLAQTAQPMPVAPAPGVSSQPQTTPVVTPTPAPVATSAASTTVAAALPTLPNHATLLRLVKAAELEGQLSGAGPFTLFAPNDAAFSRLPPGTLDTLLAPSNQAGLQTILKNHIVPGTLTEAQLRAQIKAGGGQATLNTLSGQPLTASLENNVVLLTDAVGNKSFIDRADLAQTNGVIHATNGISLPKLG